MAPDALCNTMKRVADCVGDSMGGFGTRSGGRDSFGRCAQILREDFVEGLQDYGEKINAIGNGLRGIAPRVARFLGLGRRPAQQLFDHNAVLKQVVGLQKTLRTIEDLPQRHQSLKQNFEAMRDTAKAFTEGTPELITDAEQDIAADGVDDDEREAFFALVEDTDYNYSDAAAMDDEELEDVYTGEADVVDTLGTVSDGGGPATCAEGYAEFSVDDKTSTCVLSSLVERNCYAGSREVTHPDLGDASGACLYYSLDYFQPDGTCRQNYAKVTFQGRETCRWAQLDTDRSAWYTLEKEHGIESPQHRMPGRKSQYPSSCDDYTQRNWGLSFQEYGQWCLDLASGACCQVCTYSIWAFCGSCGDTSGSACRYYPSGDSQPATVEQMRNYIDPIDPAATKRGKD